MERARPFPEGPLLTFREAALETDRSEDFLRRAVREVGLEVHRIVRDGRRVQAVSREELWRLCEQWPEPEESRSNGARNVLARLGLKYGPESLIVELTRQREELREQLEAEANERKELTSKLLGAQDEVLRLEAAHAAAAARRPRVGVRWGERAAWIAAGLVLFAVGLGTGTGGAGAPDVGEEASELRRRLQILGERMEALGVPTHVAPAKRAVAPAPAPAPAPASKDGGQDGDESAQLRRNAGADAAR